MLSFLLSGELTILSLSWSLFLELFLENEPFPENWKEFTRGKSGIFNSGVVISSFSLLSSGTLSEVAIGLLMDSFKGLSLLSRVAPNGF